MMDRVNFDKGNGLISAVVQSADSGMVLMVGFMNREALRRTIEEKRVTFWSRTRSQLWQKGESSGNYLDILSMEVDCDGDAVLIQARPNGPTCHNGTQSCFPSAPATTKQPVLENLIAIIRERKAEMPEGSYTEKLFRSGVPKIAQKVGEEAVELAIAAQFPETRRIVEESADLLYHFLVLLAAKNIPFSEIEAELRQRMKP